MKYPLLRYFLFSRDAFIFILANKHFQFKTLTSCQKFFSVTVYVYRSHGYELSMVCQGDIRRSLPVVKQTEDRRSISRSCIVGTRRTTRVSPSPHGEITQNASTDGIETLLRRKAETREQIPRGIPWIGENAGEIRFPRPGSTSSFCSSFTCKSCSTEPSSFSTTPPYFVIDSFVSLAR